MASMDARNAPQGTPGPWPHRLALATWIASIPLVLFGGTVTTMRAGMAEDGWLNPDGHFLWFYPLARRAQSLGFFVEHHHREFGSLVGLLAIGAAICAWRREDRRLGRVLPGLALLAVCLQGLLGGLRVLENSPNLAFVHGALAQAVFALLAATVVYLSPRWRAARATEDPLGGASARSSSTAAVLTFAQVVLGAIFRHSGNDLALSMHVLLSVGVLASVVVTCRHLRTAARQGEELGVDRRVLLAVVVRLQTLLGLQVLLGLLTTFFIYEVSGGMQAPVSLGEAVFATAHVAVGALLLASTVEAALWSRRVLIPVSGSGWTAVEGAR